jgi:DNA polymerase-3 subunit alpha
MTGQMSLLDFLGGDEKEAFEVKMPEVEDYSKEEKLAFEKQVLGVYISGHPLEDYTDMLNKYADATSQDFAMEEGSDENEEEAGMQENLVNVQDQKTYTVGGLIADMTIKITRNNQNMAFLTLEDLYGSVEIVVFPRDFEKYRSLLVKDAKVLITGRASVSEEGAKLILSRAFAFDDMPKDVWLQFETKDHYHLLERQLYDIIDSHPGNSVVKVYIKDGKLRKNLPEQFGIRICKETRELLKDMVGSDNVIVKEQKQI